MLTTSDAINEIAAALAKAQAEMGNAIKDATNPAFRSKYADLAAVRAATCGPLSAAGIAVVQAPGYTDTGAVTVETRLVHASGQWLACSMAAMPKDGSPQSVGSTVTYLRRYGLLSMAGIAPDDDDGNAAQPGHGQHAPPVAASRPQERARPAAPAKAPPAAHDPSWTDSARKAFMDDLGKLGWEYEEIARWCEDHGKPRPSQMDAATRSKLLAYTIENGQKMAAGGGK